MNKIINMMKLFRLTLYLYISVIILTAGGILVSAHAFAEPFSQESSLPQELVLRKEFDLNSNRTYKLPIIMYHSTFKKKPGNFNVPPEQLEKDFIWLKENGYSTITVADLIRFQRDNVALPQKPIMLTFDDGYTNNYLYMFPLLKEYDMKCVIAVIGFLTDRNYKTDSESPNPSWAHMDYEQIRTLNESGIAEIQNHTYNMHHYGGKRYGLRKRKDESAVEYEENLTKDLKKLDDKLKENSGVTTTAVVYPYGAYSRETVPVLKKMGYKASFTCCKGINEVTRTSSLFNLKRNNRPYGQTSSQYFESILGEIS